MSKDKFPFIIDLLLKIGIIAIILFVALVFLKLWYVKTAPDGNKMKRSVDFSNLGKEGSICGGAERYPCMPGLICDYETGDQSDGYGTCEKFLGTPATLVGQGEACDDMNHCGPGLRCMKEAGSASGTCIQIVVPDLDY